MMSNMQLACEEWIVQMESYKSQIDCFDLHDEQKFTYTRTPFHVGSHRLADLPLRMMQGGKLAHHCLTHAPWGPTEIHLPGLANEHMLCTHGLRHVSFSFEKLDQSEIAHRDFTTCIKTLTWNINSLQCLNVLVLLTSL